MWETVSHGRFTSENGTARGTSGIEKKKTRKDGGTDHGEHIKSPAGLCQKILSEEK